ncbi:hypothetical protein H9P43_005442 [Blastocladiella emersonii ATCC 22665]|nr:hypothetical protein H9P43_005442 [Blastocladiella emersonii ATCC 22665]
MARTSLASILTVLALAVLASTTLVAAQSPLEECVKTFDANKDCFTAKSTNEAAKYFKVDYKNYYKVVTVNNTFAPITNYTLVIRGAPKTNLPTNVNGTFEIPVRNATVFDTTSVPYLELLGKRGQIQSAASPSYVTSACFQKLISAGTIKTVDDKNVTNANTTLATADVIFSGVGQTLNVSTGKWVTQAASSDPGALNRVEWLEYFAQWFGLEGDAQKITTEITARYNAAKAAAARAKPASPLKVAWVSYSAPASWNGNQASWSFSAAAYKKDLVTDAGATFVTPAVSTYTDVAEFRKQLTDVDVAIYESFSNDTLATFTSAFGLNSDFKMVKNAQVYGLDKRVNGLGFMDWFESALVFPNVVLVDLMTIVSPRAVPAGVTRRYLRKLDSESQGVVATGECSGDASAAQSVQGPESASFSSLPTSAATRRGGAESSAVTAAVAVVVGIAVSMIL